MFQLANDTKYNQFHLDERDVVLLSYIKLAHETQMHELAEYLQEVSVKVLE